jgi:hypothetical protein
LESQRGAKRHARVLIEQDGQQMSDGRGRFCSQKAKHPDGSHPQLGRRFLQQLDQLGSIFGRRDRNLCDVWGAAASPLPSRLDATRSHALGLLGVK